MTVDASFDDTRLPDNIEQNAQGGPTFSTTVVGYASGAETRVVNWLRQRCAYDISYGVQSYDDYLIVLAFFYARQGRGYGFRFKDWSDYICENETLEVMPDNRSYQLTKTYADALRPYTRNITRCIPSTLVVTANGVPVTNYSFTGLGIITFTAPLAAPVIATYFEFDVPVRFDQDTIDLTAPFDSVASIGSIKLIELREIATP